MSALEVCSRQGAIQIQVYLYLYLFHQIYTESLQVGAYAEFLIGGASLALSHW